MVIINFYATFEVIIVKAMCEQWQARLESLDAAAATGKSTFETREVEEEQALAAKESERNSTAWMFSENVPPRARSLRKCSRHTFGALIIWINMMMLGWGLYMYFSQPDLWEVLGLGHKQAPDKHNTPQ